MSEKDDVGESKGSQGAPEDIQQDVEPVNSDALTMKELQELIENGELINDLPPIPDDVKERMEQEKNAGTFAGREKGKGGKRGR